MGYFRAPHTGPAQQRYGDYFGAVLYAPTLPKPEASTFLLSQIVCNGFELLNTSAGDAAGDGGGQWLEDDSAPFLVVFQYGRSVWAGFPETRVSHHPPNHSHPLSLPADGQILHAASEHHSASYRASFCSGKC